MRISLLALGCALLVIACTESRDAPVVVPAGKPTAGGDEALGVLAISSTAAVRPPRPAHRRDLRVRAYGRSPIGPVLAAHVAEHRVSVEIVSHAEVPVALVDGRIRLEVRRNGRALRGCATGVPVAIESPRVLAPGESFVASAPLPCPLVERGTYDVLATVELGDEDRVTGDRLTARMPLEIDGRAPSGAAPTTGAVTGGVSAR